MTHTALSFVYNKLLRHKVGPDVPPGTFMVEPDLAERWEAPDDTTYIFHLRQGVKWHNKPPVNGRELVAEDVQFSFNRFLTVPGNPERQLLGSVDRVQVVDRYTVKFVLKEPFVCMSTTPSSRPWCRRNGVRRSRRRASRSWSTFSATLRNSSTMCIFSRRCSPVPGSRT
jgi:hypothetical protein